MTRRRDQSGFALLLVFAMAAIVAIMLYLELPRVAFESQRAREDLLIQRGEQYKRAIQLFVRRFQRYPATLEALENTNNLRFLRRRYKDPMTGKDEWRLIHAGPGGVLTDSLTQKPPEKKDASSSTTLTDPGSSGSAPPVTSALRPRRQSEMGQLPMPGGTGGFISGELQPGQANPQPDPSAQPPQTSPPYPGFQPVQPGQPYPGFQPVQPGQPYPVLQPVQPGQPPQPYPYQPTVPGQPPFGPPVPGVPGLYTPGGQQLPGTQSPYTPAPPPGFSPTFPSQSPGTQTPGQIGPGQAPVPDLINQMLRQPRQQPGVGMGTTIGGGIAGVASTLEAEGIKVYNDRTKYNEWEFIYDPRKDISSALSMMSPNLSQPGLNPTLPGLNPIQPGINPTQPNPIFTPPGKQQ